MSVPATIPFSSARTAPRPWTPSDRDRLIFQWVKFEGQTQSWVAQQLELSQSTVSRILDRYERWIAHGGPATAGALSHDERLRSQHWLTYERNEWILGSALRIAGEMEQHLDVSKSTVTRSPSKPSQESEVRTQHATLDRSGIAARFLRLAYRINMDQHKLVKEGPPPPLEPLSIDELSDDDLLEAEPQQRSDERQPPAIEVKPMESPKVDRSGPERSELANDLATGASYPSGTDAPASTMHDVHNEASNESIENDAYISTCDQKIVARKTTGNAYPVAARPPESADQHAPPAASLASEGHPIAQAAAAFAIPASATASVSLSIC